MTCSAECRNRHRCREQFCTTTTTEQSTICCHQQLITPSRYCAEYCDQPVCLSVCLSVCEHISGTTGPIGTKFCLRIPCGRGSVLLWQRCTMLCSSGFMDDVTFGRNGRDAEIWRLHSAMAINDVAIPGQSLMSMNACFDCELHTIKYKLKTQRAHYVMLNPLKGRGVNWLHFAIQV